MKQPLPSGEVLSYLEERFKQVSSLVGDMSTYPISKDKGLEFKTDKDKSREFAEVFTPIYIVDEMIETIPEGGMSQSTSNLDLCSGYGQFTIRMLRKLYKVHGKSFDIGKYIRDNHFFSELQISSCYKLLWIFSGKINLAIGDALKLGKLPKNAKGIWYYHEGIDFWVCITGLVQSFLKAVGYSRGGYSITKEKEFVAMFDKFESKMGESGVQSIKQIISTKGGREKLLGIINEATDGVEQNWQDKVTPEWVIREMVNTLEPFGGVKAVGKILVLFNIEFLECLVKEKGVDPRKITFGYDSELEGLFASAVYKVDTLSIGKDFDSLVESTKGCAGKFDVIFSNPPYQIMDGGHGASARPIYHDIVCHVIDCLQPRYVSMITPSRWMIGGKGLDDYRARMSADRRIRLIQDFPGNRDIFQEVDINGGVSYFLWDKDYSGECEFNGIRRYLDRFDIVVRDNTAISILDKVLTKCDTFSDKMVLPRKPFGLPTNFKDFVEEGTEGAVKCYVPIKHGFEKWVSSDVIEDKHGVLAKWKVFTPCACPGSDSSKISDKTIISQIFVGSKISACIETYIVTGAFNTKNEAENYATYIHTKFYRFMLSLRVISQHINTQKFSWVPDLQDYSKAWTDEELYKHFGLTRKEIDHIESTIKELK